MTRAAAWIRLLRPSHWVKNVFVLTGAFFAHALGDADLLGKALVAFVVFCLASGAVYALNDACDREADARHPRKRLRPVAAGLVSAGAAIALSTACALAALMLAARTGLELLVVTGLYLAVNVAYTRRLKHVVLADVSCIAAGFLLRLLAGTWGIGIPPSQWFVLCTFLLSLFLGFSKRYAERMDASQDDDHKRAVMEAYPPEFLRMLLAVTLACTLMTYGLYTMSPRTVEIHGTGNLVYTLPFAALAMFRYLWLVTRRGFGEDLASELPRDPALAGAIAAYVAVTATILMRA